MTLMQEFPTYVNVDCLNGRVQHHVEVITENLTPCFQLQIYLEGSQSFYIDDKLFEIDAGQGAQARPLILLMNRTQKATLRSLPSFGEQTIRKVKVSLPASWLRAFRGNGGNSKELRDFASGHLNAVMWRPDSNLQDLAKSILHPQEGFGFEPVAEALSMLRQAKALELVSHACANMIANRNTTGIGFGSRELTEKARLHILDHWQEDLTIDALAKDIGASKRSLQRSFKVHFGLTISDFIRKHRLERARAALEKEGISVSQAAYLAKYNTISSFSSAFKQQYGSTPKAWKRLSG